MYIYHNTDSLSLISILNDGKLKTGKSIGVNGFNIHDKLQKYIYFNMIKKKDFKYLFPHSIIFPSSILSENRFYINPTAQIGKIKEETLKYKKNTDINIINLTLKLLFKYIMDYLKKKKITKYKKYIYHSIYHEIFIDKELDLKNMEYITLETKMCDNDRIVIEKIKNFYPNTKIVYVPNVPNVPETINKIYL